MSLAVSSCGGGNDNGGDGTGKPLVIDDEKIASAELYAAAQEQGEFTLYDNYPEEQWRALLDVFEEDTGIAVEHVRLVTSQLYERVVSEAAAGRPVADAVGFGDVTLMADLAERDIIAAYESPVGTSALKEDQYDTEAGWYTSANLGMVLAYNTACAERPVETYEDLLDPAYRGKIGLTPITVGGSAFSVYHFLRKTYGIEFWEKLAAQQPRIYESVVPLTQDLVRCEVPVSITSLGVVADQAADGAPVAPVFPEDGFPVFPNLVATTADSENPEAARVYLNWLLSERGQEALVEITREYPSRGDVDPPQVEGVKVPPADSEQVVSPGFQAWVELRNRWTKEWNATFR
ncbi:ABC transporter substrate-binding protein [Qaidamihabitans albus]|uniref:ABC transporter substrate-binding protein n=1 Tax=Qaidamihabitans albus TaxID=2795733 RepID=UPI0018F19664|nr:extracellular solute-binding protein [Qaidamihabitans albus]